MMAGKVRTDRKNLRAKLELNTTWKVLVGFLILTQVLGGGASSNVAFHTLVQITALGLLGFVALTRRELARGTGVQIVLALLVLVPLIQILPLPWHIWASLPGRGFAAQIIAVVAPGAWYPLSLDPAATQSWLIALSVPVASFLLARGMGEGERAGREGIPFLWGIVLLGCASGLLGLAQLVTGSLHLHISNHNNFPVGFFANRNHQADAMALTLGSVLLLAVRGMRQGQWGRVVWTCLPVVLLTITVAMLTQSRAGLVLTGLSVIPAFVMLRRSVNRWIVLACLALAGVAAGWLLLSGSGEGLLARMAKITADERFVTLDDIWFLVRYNFPIGTGLGTFALAFLPVESLTSVSQVYLNHAHSDYLEVLAEAGLIGAIAILAGLGWWLVMLVRVVRLPATDDEAFVKLAAVSILALLFVHSLGDYPLRTFALLAIAGACVGLLTRSASVDAQQTDPVATGHGRLKSAGTVLVLVVLVLGGIQLLRLSLSTIRIAQAGVQVPLGPPSTTGAYSLLAQNNFDQGQLDLSEQNATIALSYSPYNSQALEILGSIALEQGDAARARELLSLAARVTWRNSDAQLWQVRQSVMDSNFAGAVDAADALLRRGEDIQDAMQILVSIAVKPDARAPLVARLAENPPWAKTFRMNLLSVEPKYYLEVEAFLIASMEAGYRPVAGSWKEFFNAALDRGQGQAIARMARLANPGVGMDPGKSVVDPNFAIIGTNRSLWGPFGWNLLNLKNYFQSGSDGSEGHVLRVFRAGGGKVLSQTLMLAPGRYKLTGRASRKNANNGLASWAIECRSTSSRVAQVRIDAAAQSDFTTDFSISRECPVQNLILEVIPDTSDSLINLQYIRAEPINAQS